MKFSPLFKKLKVSPFEAEVIIVKNNKAIFYKNLLAAVKAGVKFDKLVGPMTDYNESTKVIRLKFESR